MTLSKSQTHLLNGFIADEDVLFGAPFVSNSNYNDLVDEVATWKIAYDATNLYVTLENNTVVLKAGIDQFPVPKKR